MASKFLYRLFRPLINNYLIIPGIETRKSIRNTDSTIVSFQYDRKMISREKNYFYFYFRFNNVPVKFMGGYYYNST